MLSPLPWLALAAGVAIIGYLLMRANELFVLDVHRGKARIVRGRLPQRLLNDLTDVTQAARAEGRIRVVVQGGAPRLIPRGDLSPNVVQRLRNVLSQWPVAKIKNAPPPRR